MPPRYKWSPTMHRAYARLSELADDTGTVQVTYERLCTDLGTPITPLYRAVRNLIACGAVEMVAKGGSHRANVYRVIKGF